MTNKRLLRAVKATPFTKTLADPQTGYPAYVIIGLRLDLEDGHTFTMVNIPYDVAEAIKMITEEGQPPPQRQSLFALLINNEYFREMIESSLKEVVIDELDENTGLYTASAVFHQDGVTLKVKMIPSHAVYLALLAGKPIYVREDFVDENLELEEDGWYEEE